MFVWLFLLHRTKQHRSQCDDRLKTSAEKTRTRTNEEPESIGGNGSLAVGFFFLCVCVFYYVILQHILQVTDKCFHYRHQHSQVCFKVSIATTKPQEPVVQLARCSRSDFCFVFYFKHQYFPSAVSLYGIRLKLELNKSIRGQRSTQLYLITDM